MSLEMSAHVVPAGEGVEADRADKGPLSRMASHVPFHIFQPREPSFVFAFLCLSLLLLMLLLLLLLIYAYAFAFAFLCFCFCFCFIVTW